MMEEFIIEMRENMKKKEKGHIKYTLNRECLSLLFSKKPPQIINLHKGKDKGDLVFSISLKECGISDFDVYNKFKPVILNSYIGNFLGEFLVRENLDMFANMLMNLETSEYMSVVNSWKHKKFGVEFSGGLLSFYFHASLIQQILTEDFREGI